MKQKITFFVAMVLALSASAGERSSGGKMGPPRGIAYIFDNQSFLWPDFEKEYAGDMDVIQTAASDELGKSKLIEFRKGLIELDRPAPGAHGPLRYFYMCVNMGEYTESSRVSAIIDPKLKHSLGRVFVETCDTLHIQVRYRNAARI